MLTIPVLAAFTVMLLHFMVLYRTRVQAPIFASLGAAFSAMALQLTVARAVADGVFKDGVPFVRTAKGVLAVRIASASRPCGRRVLGALLLIGSLGLYLTNEQQVTEISSSARSCWCRACPSSPRWLSPCSSARRSTISPPGASLRPLSTYRPRLPRGRQPTAGPPASGDVGILP